MKSKSPLFCLLIFILGCLIYAQGLNVHGFEFRDDEVFYKRSTQAMVETGEIMSPKYYGEDRFQKPILYYWCILLSYKVFGVNWFAARFTSCLFAAGTLVLTWLIARSLFSRGVAHLSVVLLMTVPLFFRHAKNAVPDMALNFFIVLAIYFFIRFTEENHKWGWAAGFFVACGLGFMIKGFAALLFPYFTVLLYALWEKNWTLLKDMRFFRGTFIFLAVVLPWFLYMIFTHGSEYLEYMWYRETTDRLLKVEEGHFILRKVRDFFSHLFFYLEVLLQLFAPWSLIFFGALIGMPGKCRNAFAGREPYRFMTVWILSVLTFFSFMYFTISHYMLVLSTPFAILTAEFIMRPLPQHKSLALAIQILRRHVMLIFFVVLMIVYAFILLFFGGAPVGLVGLTLAIGIVASVLIMRSSVSSAPVVLLAGLMVAVIVQAPHLSQLGLTTHMTWREFARTIHQQDDQSFVLGVASHDLHEKELQIYFPEDKIGKYANDDDKYTTYMLKKLFRNKQRVYCLMTEKDYNKYLKDQFESLDVVQEAYMLRKRLNIDSAFFAAIFRLDRETIFHYFMENVVLLKREQRV